MSCLMCRVHWTPGVQLMKWTPQKLIHCAIKASPETTIFWQLPMPITDYLLLAIPEYRVSLHSDNLLPSPTACFPSFVSIYDCLVVWRLAAAWLKTRFTFFLSCFLPIKIVIFMRWRHSQKKQQREREESPRERECVGNTPSTHKKKVMDRPETDKKTSSVANLNWFTASLYRATPRLDFSGF